MFIHSTNEKEDKKCENQQNEKKKTLDGDFPGGWGNYAEAAEIMTGDAPAEHEITIRAAEGNKADGFTLLGLLLS